MTPVNYTDVIKILTVNAINKVELTKKKIQKEITPIN